MIGLPIQLIDLGIRDAIGNPTDCLSEEGCVVLLVELGSRESLDDVAPVDLELRIMAPKGRNVNAGAEAMIGNDR